jgi:hypothetical protein
METADPFLLPRQACRCGYAFGSLEAWLRHAEYQTPADEHTHPADAGLEQFGEEWIIPSYVPVPPTKTIKASTHKAAVQSPARRTDTSRLTCADCGTIFAKRQGRGRPPKRCYDCKGA